MLKMIIDKMTSFGPQNVALLRLFKIILNGCAFI